MASSSSSGGTSIVGLLGVGFVILKLTHVINWSWWWVTMPFWGGIAVFGGIAMVGLFVTLIALLATRKG